ncbi:hypothetical protein Micbo1qcDRAFT_161818, partial [Microdochium bolleyi]
MGGCWSVSGLEERSVDVSEASSPDEKEPLDERRGETEDAELGECGLEPWRRRLGVGDFRPASRLAAG